jgi:hypothetical protein
VPKVGIISKATYLMEAKLANTVHETGFGVKAISSDMSDSKLSQIT